MWHIVFVHLELSSFFIFNSFFFSCFVFNNGIECSRLKNIYTETYFLLQLLKSFSILFKIAKYSKAASYACWYCLYIFPLSSPGKGRFFRLRLPSLNLLGSSKQSLPQEDPDTVMVDSPKASNDSVPLRDFHSLTKDSCSPADANDTQALISSSPHSSPISVSGPLDHSSPKQLWDRPSLSQAQSTTCLAQSISRDSVCSRRRASSVHDIEGLSSNSKRLLRDRHTSEGK